MNFCKECEFFQFCYLINEFTALKLEALNEDITASEHKARLAKLFKKAQELGCNNIPVPPLCP